MKAFNKHLLDKFFNDSCSPEQAEEVLDWLDTPEGQEYLDERLQNELEGWDEDGKEIKQKENSFQVSKKDPVDSTLLFQKIMLRLGWNSLRPFYTFFKPLIQVAAVLTVITTATLFYFYTENHKTDTDRTYPVIYSTNSGQQKRVTLRDGSVVRLNKNSSLTIHKDYNRTERDVILSGEAFFDITHNSDKPFVVRSGQSVIEVLGTSFNVKLNSDQTEVGVAVTEGKVLLRHNDADHEQGALLAKGQFASLNTATREIYIEDGGIDNYLAWKNGRLVFDDMRMEMVCLQLGRLYEISCAFHESAIKDRILTGNFSNESLEKVLSVIEASLDLTYEKKDRVIYWKNDHSNQ